MFPAAFDKVLADAGIAVVLTGIRMPRMNTVMERWVRTCRHELLNRTLIWNQAHLLRHCASSRAVISIIARTAHCIRPRRYVPYPNRSPNKLELSTSTFENAIDSAGSYTGTNMLPGQRGRINGIYTIVGRR